MPRLFGAVADVAALATGRVVPKPVWDAFKEWHPDLVHLHSLHVPENIVLGRWLRAAGIPYCITVHGALSRPARTKGRFKKAAFNVLFERAYLNRAAVIHALTAEERDAIAASGVRCRIAVAPNGIDLNGLHLPDGTDRRPLLARFPQLRDRRVFMFIGRM